ncbi:MAG: hypothetical protein CM15mP14_1410 [Rhodospirillaceae bacterium]|nr:MAG: hypothetical protein CM15mP14_1410 [Rhodospirillaceae bacterium]
MIYVGIGSNLSWKGCSTPHQTVLSAINISLVRFEKFVSSLIGMNQSQSPFHLSRGL